MNSNQHNPVSANLEGHTSTETRTRRAAAVPNHSVVAEGAAVAATVEAAAAAAFAVAVD